MNTEGIKKRLVVFNDNHCEKQRGEYAFLYSKFHLFLQAFEKCDVRLSTPTLDYVDGVPVTEIDGVEVWLRPGYGRASRFYALYPLMLLRGIPRIFSHARKADAVLIVFPACFGWVSYICAKLLGKPIFAYVVGDVLEVIQQDRQVGRVRKTLERLSASWEWAVTKFVARRVTTFVLGCSLLEKLSTVGGDVHPARTSLVLKADVLLDRHIDIMQSSLSLATVGRLSIEKGLHHLIDAVATLHSEGVPCRLNLIGEGPLREALKQQVRARGLEEYVEFTGLLPQSAVRPTLLEKADIFVIPSLSEGVPKVVLEAMSIGLPVVGTITGGIPDMLGDDTSLPRGWLVPPGDPAKLAEAIGACVRDREDRIQRVDAATRYILEHTKEAEAANIETVIERTLEEAL